VGGVGGRGGGWVGVRVDWWAGGGWAGGVSSFEGSGLGVVHGGG